ncbi:MAG: DUF4132 domain-containing protein [Rhodomicrobium sp.]
MIANLLGGIFDIFKTKENIAAADLKRLSEIIPRLAEDATAYVCEGTGETVLSSLNALCKGHELEVGKTYTEQKSPTLARRRLFARAHPYDLDFMQRYAEVLNAACPVLPSDIPGSMAVPKAVRIFLWEAFHGAVESPNTWPQKAVKLGGKGLTPEIAIEMVRRLGGSLADFFELLYTQDGRYSYAGHTYRQAVDLRPSFQQYPDEATKAAQRLPAQYRSRLLLDLRDCQLGGTGEYTPFLVSQAAEGSKAVREAAIAALEDVPLETVERLAAGILETGRGEQRLGMVDLLARLGSPAAADLLKAQLEAEKTARVKVAIETAILSIERRHSPAAAEDSPTGYTALDGQRIEVPPVRPLAEGEWPKLGDAEEAGLLETIDKENERLRKHQEAGKQRGYHWKVQFLDARLAKDAISFFNSRKPDLAGQNRLVELLGYGVGRSWTDAMLAKMPDARAFELLRRLRCDRRVVNLNWGPGAGRIRSYLRGPEGDFRRIEQLQIAMDYTFTYGPWSDRRDRPMERGDLLRSAILNDSYYKFEHSPFPGLPEHAVWPYAAENLEVIDEALGLKPQGVAQLDRVGALFALGLLPATPARYFAPLLEAATGETKAGRKEARALLANAPHVEERLVGLLNDARQAVRAGAAEWLSVRKDPSAAEAIGRQLKKEKSDVSRAAMLTALQRLGVDLSNVLGPEVLIAEVEKGLKSAKFDKLNWLALNNLPPMRFANGAKVPADVLRWWVYLAFKLKQPGGNALFGIYLDQLRPADAEAFSTFVLDSWLAYDTACPSEAEANVYAKAQAPQYLQSMLRWNKDFTEEKAFAQLKSGFLSQYLHSAAESKGLLALARRASPAVAADRVRAYLKNHGSRTSQASALLEMLGGMGDAAALQVVIAAATRLKQKSVQSFAKELVDRIAEARDWTREELADRTIPTGGFDEDGVLALRCGEDGKAYEARLSSDLSISLRNPAGKEVAGLPSGQDEATAAAKKALSAAKKAIKQIVSMQSSRLYESLCAERTWAVADWLRYFHAHPVMRRLVERVVWLGLVGEGKPVGAFRPTAEGDFTDASDEPVDAAQFAQLRLAHGALLNDAQTAAWKQHLADYEIKPLFEQFGRPLLTLAPNQADKTEIEDRKGFVTDAFTIRGAAAKLGYERGAMLDGPYFNDYRKPFQSAGLCAVIEFSGNTLPEENVPAALIKLKFVPAEGLQGEGLRLSEIPPVLLSECWNDYHAMAAKAAYDANWEKKTPW